MISKLPLILLFLVSLQANCALVAGFDAEESNPPAENHSQQISFQNFSFQKPQFPNLESDPLISRVSSLDLIKGDSRLIEPTNPIASASTQPSSSSIAYGFLILTLFVATFFLLRKITTKRRLLAEWDDTI